MRMYKALITAGLLSILLFFSSAQPLEASSSGEERPNLFSSHVVDVYLCTPQMTRRSPERCPAFSPGAREVRMEYLRARLPEPLPALPAEQLPLPEEGVSRYTFAYVRNLPAPAYGHPVDAESGAPPKRVFEAGMNWVSIVGTVEHNGETWYQVNSEEFVRAEHIAVGGPSRFRGVLLTEQPRYPLAWINRGVSPSPLPGDAPDESVVYSRYELVMIYAQELLGDTLWYMIGPDRWVDQYYVARVDVDPRPEGVGPDEKWLEVDTFEQTLAAYEGDRMVFATLISSGRSSSWTPDGLTRIWAKIPSAPMSNHDVGPGDDAWYYLEHVEWTQYFFEDYALHTAYWHDAFGFTRSHGCVNLSPLDAQWLFEWTTPTLPDGAIGVYAGERYGEGTWVWVHKSEPVPGYEVH